MPEPTVTTTMFTEPEKAAWEVAVSRGVAITAADLRALLAAAAEQDIARDLGYLQGISEGAAAERERQRSLLPYVTPCCDGFKDAVADLINEHEDT